MFLDRILSAADKEALLFLHRRGIIDHAPKDLVDPDRPKARSVCALPANTSRRDPITGTMKSVYVNVDIVPRIRDSQVRLILENFIKQPFGVNALVLSKLFALGLGCPKMPRVATLLSSYDEKEDKDGETLTGIARLVNDFRKTHRVESESDFWHYPAEMVLQLINLRSRLKAENATETVRIPDGPAAVMFYSRDLNVKGRFVLTGGYEIGHMGMMIPICHTVLRPEAKNLVTSFTSQALAAFPYVMVIGNLMWPDNPYRNLLKTRYLASDDYSVLIDRYPEYRTPEMENLIEATKSVDRRNELIERLGADKGKAELGRMRHELEELERKVVRKLRKSGPVAQMSFVALDLLVCQSADSIVGVRNPLDKTHGLMSKLGFMIPSTCGYPLTEKAAYEVTATKSRAWNL